MKKFLLALSAAFTLLAVSCTQKTQLTFKEIQKVQSPGGVLELTAGLTPEGTPVYTLSRGEQAVVLPSRLGFDLMDGSNLKEGFSVKSVARDSLDETWEPVWGETSVSAYMTTAWASVMSSRWRTSLPISISRKSSRSLP